MKKDLKYFSLLCWTFGLVRPYATYDSTNSRIYVVYERVDRFLVWKSGDEENILVAKSPEAVDEAMSRLLND